MANNFRLTGEIKFIEIKEGQNSKGVWKRATFKLAPERGGWLPCSTFSKSIINAIQEGMYVEFTDYKPRVDIYEDKMGQKKSWFDLEVYGLDILRDSLENVGVVNDKRGQMSTTYIQNKKDLQFDTKEIEQAYNDWEKTAKEEFQNYIMKETGQVVSKEEDEGEPQVSLAWLDEFKDKEEENETPPPPPQKSSDDVFELIVGENTELTDEIMEVISNLQIQYTFKPNPDRIVCYSSENTKINVVKNVWNALLRKKINATATKGIQPELEREVKIGEAEITAEFAKQQR